jgi:hypothetical protein
MSQSNNLNKFYDEADNFERGMYCKVVTYDSDGCVYDDENSTGDKREKYQIPQYDSEDENKDVKKTVKKVKKVSAENKTAPVKTVTKPKTK